MPDTHTEAALPDSPEKCPQPGDRVKVRCDHCTGKGTTWTWAKIKVSNGWMDEWRRKSVQIPVKCDPCSGNGFTTGALR